ncbi:asparagine synthase (glutamine-hydrolyzing) [Campylobacter fetus]|uniref:asparagine synthase (glutamine-hydrolyzing) n=3 Tax=Campylobacter fetus TaxID=196 RepID=A0AAX0H9B6_CAMFE|nr:asparagine synthase (glutamine-hydrolyzing) [Campylobacter fetus]ALV65579.1 asparagine synthase (glutamine-hydrolyzing) [Campylobacter fetus subsp. testudinum Sp3]OCR90120.1 asparagine synthase [Campylobacter fetus subsp. testudinum]OCR92387.1 asparagine synthase [Campylobacter fetus subsp. testudinum]
MCGIIGINSKNENLQKALNLLKDRGPDSSGVYRAKNATLGHTRLSIIDLSSCGSQPMKKDNLTIVFNGEIYNYKELANSENISITSDTQILLHMYQKYGKGFLSKLNGMFAFVIYDEQDNSFFGARDTFGKKPLFYYNYGGNFIFSSRINAILELLDFTPEPNLDALDSYLSFMSPTRTQTFYKNIFKIEAGSAFTYKNGKLNSYKFETLDGIKTQSINFDEAKSEVLNLLKTSLEIRLRSDVPVSFLLSGGLDSSLLCALYAKEYDKNFDTFSLGFNEYKTYDETNWASSVAKYIGSNHHRIELEKKDFFDIFEKFYDFVDEPLADSATIPTYFLSKKIHENGYKVALSGEGSDECFMGYDLYFRVLEFYQKNLKKESYPLISKDYEYLRRKELNLPIYGSAGEVFTKYQKESLLKNQTICEQLSYYQNGYDGLTQMSYIDFKIWVSEVLTTKIDRASMANSLEIRSPFLDVNLVKFSLSIPDNIKFKTTNKEILKSIAYNYLPKETIERKKKGFSSPFIEWVIDEMGDNIVNEILSINKFIPLFNEDFVKILYQKAIDGRFKQHLWTLLHLAIWLKKRYKI